VRLFVAVQPPEPVLDEIEQATRELRQQVGERRTANLRWATRDQWHVTLRFLGEVADDVVPRLAGMVDAAPLVATEAELGSAFVRLGRQVLAVPVSGLEDLAMGIAAATSGVGRPPESRPYWGHVTVARVRGRSGGTIHRSLIGASIGPMRWLIDEVRIVRSHLGGAGSRYEDLHVRRVAPEVESDGT
jgi:2'-5' RNA ligase